MSTLTLHGQLLSVLRRSIRLLSAEESFNGENTYLDLFGAALSRSDPVNLTSVATHWLGAVAGHAGFTFDALFTPKSGNIVLADHVANHIGPNRLGGDTGLIIAKHTQEKSAVREAGQAISAVNFEGFAEFLKQARDLPKLRVLAFDDSCQTGLSLRVAIERFNKMITRKPDIYPVETIVDAIVLFRREIPRGETDGMGRGVNLHALLSLSNDEILALSRTQYPHLSSEYDRLAERLLKTDSGAYWLRTSEALANTVAVRGNEH